MDRYLYDHEQLPLLTRPLTRTDLRVALIMSIAGVVLMQCFL